MYTTVYVLCKFSTLCEPEPYLAGIGWQQSLNQSILVTFHCWITDGGRIAFFLMMIKNTHTKLHFGLYH